MIRRAGPEDVPELLALATWFNADYYEVPLNPEKAAAFILRTVEHGVVLMSDCGFIAGVLVDDPLRDWTALVEIAWFARTGGAQLLSAFCAVGRKLRADEVRVCTMHTSPPGVVRVLRRRGFAATETSHRLIL